MKVKLNLTGSETEIEITRQGAAIAVKIGARTISGRILQQEGPSLLLALVQPDGSERLLRIAGVAQGDKRQLWVDGRTYAYQRLLDKPAGSGAADTGSLSASIPSVVTQILVAAGDEVAAGDKLILLESMKMIMPIQAPYDGRVTAVQCRPGEAVQPGVPLIEVQPL
jgi:biotin carboxyl carrier protein